MSAPRPTAKLGEPSIVSEVAASWVLRREKGPLSVAEETRLAAWLAASPDHVAAYECVLWGLDAVVRHAGDPEVMALRASALAHHTPRRAAWRYLAGGSLAAAIVVGGIVLAPHRSSGDRSPEIAARAASEPAVIDAGHAVYRTAIGERKSIRLPDGSVMTLDTASRARVDYAATERGVHLIEGQALFQVAKGKPVPFRVYVGDQRVTAVGTVFDVRLDDKAVHVAMVEGIVRVRTLRASTQDQGAPIQEMALIAGEALTAAPGLAVTVKTVDADVVSSWTSGLLTFNDTPLSRAVAQFNRYTTDPVMIEDPAVGAYRLSGVFRTGEPDQFLRAITDMFPVEIDRSMPGRTILRERVN